MKKRYKRYIKLNIVSLVFITISFMSITLAWFAYSGLTQVKTEIGVKAWNIEMKRDGNVVSNDVTISLSDIYPGMETLSEIINIKNNGDADANIKYSIISARILDKNADDYVIDDNILSEYVEDKLSHDYPFHVNINISKAYALANGGESVFGISVSWPLDSGIDKLDSIWGNNAYLFQDKEKKLLAADSSYQVKPAIEIKISLMAEQDMHNSESSDYLYNLGDHILYDVVDNNVCITEGDSCLSTHVIDNNNLMGDTTITLLPELNETYLPSTYDKYTETFNDITSSWNVTKRPLIITDILPIVSNDINSSFLVRNGISNSLIGNLKYTGRIEKEIVKVVNASGYYSFLNSKYGYFAIDNCYWINSNYDTNRAFAVMGIGNNTTKIYGELKTTSCKVLPVIIINKPNDIAY